jgi:beta-glucanase (GH16 family)
VRPPLVAALAALVVVPVVTVWGVESRSAGHGGSGRPTASISYPNPASAPSQSTQMQPPAVDGGGWRLVYHSRFQGRSLNTAAWGTCYPWAKNPSIGCTNFGNVEKEWYLPTQDVVRLGALNLVAQRLPTAGQTRAGRMREYACRSGMVTTFPSFHFKYGYVKVVSRPALGYGLWSAIWLAAANLKWPPEIDLIEAWGDPSPKAGVYFHPVGGDNAKTHLTPAQYGALDNGWHAFSLLWTRRMVAWFVDGKPIMVIRHSIPHQSMYLIANLADYTLKSSAGCTGRMLIKSVQVWQQ